MNIAFYLKLYALTLPVFFVIDILWLGVVARGFYRSARRYRKRRLPCLQELALSF